ncbi:hypothetical protein Dimus_038709 [Dionaea muscipula]
MTKPQEWMVSLGRMFEIICYFTRADVQKVLEEIADDKAPGVDGFTVAFFKKSWLVIGDDVCKVVLDFFSKKKMLTEVNLAVLHMVPNGQNPTCAGDYRPVACCTTMYQIISKMLCRNLVAVLPILVDPAQSAFVKGRSIVDNVLLCQELINGYERKGISPRCLARIDLRKAYDSISWKFVELLLEKLNFPQQFRDWVFVCITTASYSVVINGGTFGFFRGKRGIRQGDPISPYIFVLIMEYFTRCMRMGKDQCFRFHPRCKALHLVNLCFADDLMIFSKAHEGSLRLIRTWLDHFGRVSGLEANLSKSSVSFGGIGDDKRIQLAQVLGFGVCPPHFKYLGVPLTAKKLRVGLYQPLLDKMMSRIMCWSARNSSYPARVQLVKSILMSIQLYWSQIFLISKVVARKVESLCRAFIWAGNALSKHKALVKWDEVCVGKKYGGLDIMRIGEWNSTNLFKLVWDLANKTDGLWIKWIHSRYLKMHSIWEVSCRVDDTWSWKALLRTRDLLLPFVS